MTNLGETFDSLVDVDEVQHSILNKLNALFGTKISDLSHSSDLLDELHIKKKDLEERLQFATREAPDKVSNAIQSAEFALIQCDELQEEFSSLREDIDNCSTQNEEFVNLLSPHVEVCRKEKDVKAYLQWVKSINEISQQLETHVKNKELAFSSASFLRLRESTVVILESNCANLCSFTLQMLQYWHEVLTDAFTKELESVLKSLQWPFASTPPQTYNQEMIQTLQMSFEGLVMLQLPDKVAKKFKISRNDIQNLTKPAIVEEFAMNFSPLAVLIRPLEVRFLYHFFGNRSTNSLSHPEWFLTQILRWLNIHESFLDDYIQPIMDRNGETKRAKTEFSRALLGLAVLKLNETLTTCLDHTEHLCHTIQETLEFSHELPAWVGSRQKVTSVLTQSVIFNAWIQVERKSALGLMDEFVCSPSAWGPSEPSSLPKCGQQLILMLQGVTERYRKLTQPGHRLQFLELQVELLDDFRVRLVQLRRGEMEPLDSNYIPILNTVQHVTNTMEEWEDSAFFLELHYFREKFESLEDQTRKQLESLSIHVEEEKEDVAKNKTPFSNLLSLYNHIRSEMLQSLCQHVMSEVRARGFLFRREKWFAPQKRGADGDITPSLCPLLDVLVNTVQRLKDSVEVSLYQSLSQSLGWNLDKFFFEECILENQFSECGGHQFSFDMNSGIFPIFGDMAHKPKSFFPLIADCCTLLTLPLATMLLLRETLFDDAEGPKSLSNGESISLCGVSPARALQEAGVLHLSVTQAQKVIQTRILATDL